VALKPGSAEIRRVPCFAGRRLAPAPVTRCHCSGTIGRPHTVRVAAELSLASPPMATRRESYVVSRELLVLDAFDVFDGRLRVVTPRIAVRSTWVRLDVRGSGASSPGDDRFRLEPRRACAGSLKVRAGRRITSRNRNHSCESPVACSSSEPELGSRLAISTRPAPIPMR
jgi:hypothetical protein